MKSLVIVVLILLMSISAYADGNADRQTIERLLEVSNVESMVDSMYAEMDKMFDGLADQLQIKESEKPVFDNFMKKISAAMQKQITWDKMKEPMIDIYMRHYTQKEIEEILAFYQTETGQSLLKKMPEVMQESMQVSQTMFKDFMPTMRQIAQEMQKELAEVRSREN